MQVKLYREVAIHALKHDLDREMILWAMLRAANNTGSGVISVARARETLEPILYSKSAFYRDLKKGEGRFWNIVKCSSGRRIHIKGLRQLYSDLGVQSAGLSAPISIDSTKLNTPQKRRAWVYASIHPGQTHYRLKPISRASIEAMTGIDARTQRQYDRILHIRRYPNFMQTQSKFKRAVVMEDGKPGEYRILGRNERAVSPEWMVIKSRNRSAGTVKEYTKQRRLGNSYVTQAATCGKSLVKKVNRQLKDVGLLVDGHRRYFEKPGAMIKHAVGNRCEEPLLRALAPVINGRSEWGLAV